MIRAERPGRLQMRYKKYLKRFLRNRRCSCLREMSPWLGQARCWLSGGELTGVYLCVSEFRNTPQALTCEFTTRCWLRP